MAAVQSPGTSSDYLGTAAVPLGLRNVSDAELAGQRMGQTGCPQVLVDECLLLWVALVAADDRQYHWEDLGLAQAIKLLLPWASQLLGRVSSGVYLICLSANGMRPL